MSRHMNQFGLAKLLAMAAHLVLHCQRCIASAQRVIFVRQRRAEECHDAIAQNLVDGSLIAVNRIHHDAKNWIDDFLTLFGI